MQDRVGQRFGNYRLLRLIGTGGYAEVYLAEHIYLNNLHAVKILTGTNLQDYQRQEFLTEARTIANLQRLSPHIVQIHDFGILTSPNSTEGDIPYFAMEYAAEGTLRRLYPSGTHVPVDRILFYVKQVAEALQCAHDQKPPVVHRDVKPENMLLRSRDHVLLSDFGIAITGNTGTLGKKLELVGTVAYMAPELLSGHLRRASDQYSLGIVVYEWLCGERPFDGTDYEICFKQIKEEPPPLYPTYPHVTQEIEAVVMRALKKKPEDRYPTVQAFAQALEAAIQLSQQPTWQPPVNQSWPQAGPSIYQLPQGQSYQTANGTTIPMVSQPPSPPQTLPVQPIRQSLQGVREFFDFSPQFARDSRYSFFRGFGIFLNILSAIAVGLLLRNIPLALAGLLFSYIVFALCIRAVEEVLAMFFGILVALYWGGVGWVIAGFIAPRLPFDTSSLPVFLSIIFFGISCVLHGWYVARKNS